MTKFELNHDSPYLTASSHTILFSSLDAKLNMGQRSRGGGKGKFIHSSIQSLF